MTLQERLRAQWLDAGRQTREEAADRIDALEGEIAALRKDVERLNHIENHARCDPKMDGHHVWWPTSFNHRLVGPTLRAAIDAAMAQKVDAG